MIINNKYMDSEDINVEINKYDFDSDINICYDELNDIYHLIIKPELYKSKKTYEIIDFRRYFNIFLLYCNRLVSKLKCDIIQKMHDILDIEISRFKTFGKFDTCDNNLINLIEYCEIDNFLTMYNDDCFCECDKKLDNKCVCKYCEKCGNNKFHCDKKTFINFVQHARNEDIHGFLNIKFEYCDDDIYIKFFHNKNGLEINYIEKVSKCVHNIMNYIKKINDEYLINKNKLNNCIENIRTPRLIYGYDNKNNFFIPMKAKIYDIKFDKNNGKLFGKIKLKICYNKYFYSTTIINTKKINKFNIGTIILTKNGQYNNIYELLELTSHISQFESNAKYVNNIDIDIFNKLKEINNNTTIDIINDLEISNFLQDKNYFNKYMYLINYPVINTNHTYPYCYELVVNNFIENKIECENYLTSIEKYFDKKNDYNVNHLYNLFELLHNKNIYSEKLFHIVLKFYLFYKENNNKTNSKILENILGIIYCSEIVLNSPMNIDLYKYDDEFIIDIITTELYRKNIADLYIWKITFNYNKSQIDENKNAWKKIIIEYIKIYNIDNNDLINFDINIIIGILIENKLYNELILYLNKKTIDIIDKYYLSYNDPKLKKFNEKLEKLIQCGIDQNFFYKKYEIGSPKYFRLNNIIKKINNKKN